MDRKPFKDLPFKERLRQERLHRSQQEVGDSPQTREAASDQKGESASDILKMIKEATVKPTHENVTGTVGRAEGTGKIMQALQDVMSRRRGAAPEASKTSAAPEASITESSDRGLETPDLTGGSGDHRLDKKFENPTALYGHAYTMMEEATRKRVLENPKPTDEEWDRGIFNEELFPQFIDAIPLMWSKGYETWSSEPKMLLEEFKSPLAIDSKIEEQESLFAGKPQPVPEGMRGKVLRSTPNITLKGEDKDCYRIQQIDGRFSLEQATIEKIEALGARAETIGMGDKAYSRIFFEADEVTTLRAVKATCDRIADILL